MTSHESYLSALQNNKDLATLRALLLVCLLDEEEYYRKLARVIRSKRRALDRTQDDLAEIVGCSTETIGRIEANCNPNHFKEDVYKSSPYLLAKIMAALDLNPAIIMPIK